jgi:hypothetical protein
MANDDKSMVRNESSPISSLYQRRKRPFYAAGVPTHPTGCPWLIGGVVTI